MEIQAVVAISGTVMPQNEVLVMPGIGEVQIRQILVDIGDRVTKGDTLVRLNRDRLEAEQAQAEAQLARAGSAISQANSQIASTAASLTQAEAEHDRARQLLERGNMSQSAFDEIVAQTEAARASAASARDGLAIAEAERRQAEAQKRVADLNLSRTEIEAPVDGVIATRSARLGALTAMGGEPLLMMIEDGALEVSAEVIETALADIEPGDDAMLAVAGIGELLGIVRLVSPVVDQATRLGDVRITLEGHPDLRSGLFASGQIIIDRRTGIAVPVSAVLSGADGPYVQTLTDGMVSARPVTPGLVWRNQREIVAGLEEGEVVIARAGAFFRDGDRVRPVEPRE